MLDLAGTTEMAVACLTWGPYIFMGHGAAYLHTFGSFGWFNFRGQWGGIYTSLMDCLGINIGPLNAGRFGRARPVYPARARSGIPGMSLLL